MINNKEFYSNLIESINCAYVYLKCVYDGTGGIKDYQFVDSNGLFNGLIGMAKSEIIGKYASSIFSEQDDQNYIWLDRIKDAVISNQKIAIERYFESLAQWYLITISTHKDGHVVIVFSEITASKLIDEETGHFFQMSLDMLSLLGFDGYFKKLSLSWVNILGWSLEELKSKPMIEFVHPEDVYNTIIMIQNLTEGRSIVDFENRYLCKDGTYKWIQWRSNSVVDRGVVYAVARDVTYNKELELKLKEANKELKRKSVTDSLTNVYNHQFITEVLKKEIENAYRYSQSLTVLMLDLDGFKSVNDTYGHLAGDDVLIIVVEKIRACMRNADFLGRYGGEEFILVLPRTELEGAKILAERIRRNVEQAKFNQENLKVTISIGIADFVDQDCATMIDQADKSMYSAKHKGRNRIEIFSKK